MAYNPTTWNTGDTITAEKLNHMENGITSAQVYTESETVRFSGEVTAEGNEGIYGALINCNLSDVPEQITVVFDGTEYTVSKVEINGNSVYGGFGETDPDFSEYPFTIMTQQGMPLSRLFTETASTHQVEIVTLTKTVKEDLADLIPVMQLISGVTNSADALAAFNAGKLLYFYHLNKCYMVADIDTSAEEFNFIPENNSIICSYSGSRVEIGAQYA